MDIKHGMDNTSVINAQQAKFLNNDKNTRLKLLTEPLRMAPTSAETRRSIS